MSLLLIGLFLFLGVHSVSIVANRWRTDAIARVGETPWKLIYIVVSLVGFVLIVVGYGQARLNPTVLYEPARALRHGALVLLAPMFPLLVASYLRGRIKLAVKHPMLVATKLWAFAHLLANGGLHDVVLFGGFLVWAVLCRISLKRRGRDPEPYIPALTHDLIAIGVGLALYGWFLLQGHRWLVGVSPLG